MFRRGAERGGVDDVSALAGILQGVAPEAASKLTLQLRSIAFRRRRTIFVEGEPGNELYIIQAGKVKIRHRTEAGRETLIAVLGPGDVFGEMALFDRGERTSTATTVTEVHAVAIERHVLRTWIVEHPQIAEHLLQVLARRLRRTSSILCDLVLTDVPGRVAKQLLDLAIRFGASNGDSLHVDHQLSQKELAQLVGASRETVNKALTEFAERGWIRYRGTTVYIDRPNELAYRAQS
jgi:CRP/FNR family transcriptional regulator, cyclic AMP receptor protein